MRLPPGPSGPSNPWGLGPHVLGPLKGPVNLGGLRPPIQEGGLGGPIPPVTKRKLQPTAGAPRVEATGTTTSPQHYRGFQGGHPLVTPNPQDYKQLTHLPPEGIPQGPRGPVQRATRKAPKRKPTKKAGPYPWPNMQCKAIHAHERMLLTQDSTGPPHRLITGSTHIKHWAPRPTSTHTYN